jgi:hypothetical protein
MQHVVDAVVMAGSFYCGNVCRFLDNANQALIARRAGAVNTGIHIRNVVANRAQTQTGFDFVDGASQGCRIFFAGAQDVKSQPLGRLAANAREFFELVDQASHGFSKARHRIESLNHSAIESLKRRNDYRGS